MRGAWRTWSSGKVEPSGLQIGREAEPLRHGKLARDVFAPPDALARGIDIVVLETAGRDRFAVAATVVVSADVVLEVRVVVAFAMYHDGRRQAHGHRAAEHGPADRETGDRIDTGRQRQERRDA